MLSAVLLTFCAFAMPCVLALGCVVLVAKSVNALVEVAFHG